MFSSFARVRSVTFVEKEATVVGKRRNVASRADAYCLRDADPFVTDPVQQVLKRDQERRVRHVSISLLASVVSCSQEGRAFFSIFFHAVSACARAAQYVELCPRMLLPEATFLGPSFTSFPPRLGKNFRQQRSLCVDPENETSVPMFISAQ